MEIVRWFLGSIAALYCAGWIGFFLFANSFRRSFGATPNGISRLVIPLVFAILILISTLLPSNRPLLHLTAAAIVVIIAGCLMIVRPAPFVASAGLLYCGLWLAWYYSILTRHPTP